eukprot:1898798-Ditylum_brightwellii.AAC.1
MSVSSEPPDPPWPPANDIPSASTLYGYTLSLFPLEACPALPAPQHHAAPTDFLFASDSTSYNYLITFAAIQEMIETSNC